MPTAALVSWLWFVLGYSLAFTLGTSLWGGFAGVLGGLDRIGFQGLNMTHGKGQIAVSHIAPHLPESVLAMF